MNNKEKIRLLKKFIKSSERWADKISLLPSDLKTEVTLQANILETSTLGGALVCIRELEREERDKEIIQTQKQQTKILKEQKIFTKILALATLILGIVAFFSFFDISIASMNFSGQNTFFQIFIAMLTGLGFFVLVMAFFLLLFEIANLLIKKK